VSLKTVLMTLNVHEVAAIQQMAERMGVGFRFDAAHLPASRWGQGGPFGCACRPATRWPARWPMEDLRAWRDFLRRQGAAPPTASLYQCAAGVTGFHVDAAGSLHPCLMVADPSCSLLARSFRAGWDTVIPRLHERIPKAGFACGTCDKRALCGYCPAFFALENGAEDARSEYLCTLGQLRYGALTEAAGQAAHELREGGNDELWDPAIEETTLREAQTPSH